MAADRDPDERDASLSDIRAAIGDRPTSSTQPSDGVGKLERILLEAYGRERLEELGFYRWRDP